MNSLVGKQAPLRSPAVTRASRGGFIRSTPAERLPHDVTRWVRARGFRRSGRWQQPDRLEGRHRAAQGYDTKMVALTAMLSSVVFYNNMRKVNKMDVEFLGDVVLFDEIFRSMTQEPLLASEIVWLVQSYSSNDACADYPARFLRKLAAGTQDDDLLMHDRVIDYVLTRSREERIFCLPYPKTEPYTPEAELYALGYHELDHGYTAQIDTVRQFVAGVPPKAGCRQRHDGRRASRGH